MSYLEEKPRPLGWIFLGMVGFLLIGWAFFYFFQMVPEDTVINSRGEITLGNEKFSDQENFTAPIEATPQDTTLVLAPDTVKEEESISKASIAEGINNIDSVGKQLGAEVIPSIAENPETPTLDPKKSDDLASTQLASIENNPTLPPVEKTPEIKTPEVKIVEAKTPEVKTQEDKKPEVKPENIAKKPAPTLPSKAETTQPTQIVPYTSKTKGDKMKVMARITDYFQNLGYNYKIVGGKINYQRVVIMDISPDPLDITFYMLKGDQKDRLLVGLFKKSNGGQYLSSDRFPKESTQAQQLVARLATR